MRFLPPKAPLPVKAAPRAEHPAQQEDTTADFGAGTEPRAHRRTTVTVERETLSFLVSRPVAASGAGPGTQPRGGEATPEPLDRNVPANSPAQNELCGDKP